MRLNAPGIAALSMRTHRLAKDTLPTHAHVHVQGILDIDLFRVRKKELFRAQKFGIYEPDRRLSCLLNRNLKSQRLTTPSLLRGSDSSFFPFSSSSLSRPCSLLLQAAGHLSVHKDIHTDKRMDGRKEGLTHGGKKARVDGGKNGRTQQHTKRYIV